MKLLRCLIVVLCLSRYVYADDTEIYGTVTNTTVEPNVLVVFDTSGSMATADVPENVTIRTGRTPGALLGTPVYVRKTFSSTAGGKNSQIMSAI